MKLVRFGEAGRERPGLIDRSGAIRDLSGHMLDVAGSELDPDSSGSSGSTRCSFQTQARRTSGAEPITTV